MALAKAVQAARVVIKLGLLSAPAQVHSNKMPIALNSVVASPTALLPLPECSSTEAAIHAQLPVVGAIPLPAVVHGSPSSHSYSPCPLLAEKCKLEEKASNPAALEKGVQAAPPSQMLVGTADVKSMTEHDNDQQVLPVHSAAEDGTTPKIATAREADSPAWRASNPTALEKGVQEATPWEMLVGAADVKSMTEYDNDQPVLQDHSAAEDGTAPKIATGRETDSPAWHSAWNPQVCEHMKSEARFPDAPWRRKPAPVSEPPHGNTTMNSSASLKKLPVPPPPPPCCPTSWTRNVMAPPPAPPRTVTSTSSSMCKPLCSRWRGLPVPPPHPTTAALLAAAPSSSQKRKDRTESSRGARSNTQIRRDRGKLAAAPSSSQKSKDRAESWTGARSKTQQRRDRGKNMRINKYNRLRDAGHDVPTTGAASLRRKQKQKAKLKREAATVHGGSMAGMQAPLMRDTRRTIRAPPKSSKYRGI